MPAEPDLRAQPAAPAGPLSSLSSNGVRGASRLAASVPLLPPAASRCVASPFAREAPTTGGSSQGVAAAADALEEDDSEGEEEEDSLEGGELKKPLVPNLQLSPLDVRFSQFRARDTFCDGRSLEDTVAEIRAVPLSPREQSTASASVVAGASSSASSSSAGAREAPVQFRLEAPFPSIQVLQWRCKLRDAQGRARTDPRSGGELYDSEDRWFTLDNRRLYCLQKAAVAVWPQRAVVDVVELPPGPLTRVRTRQLKKFRTFDRGSTVLIGSRKEEAGDPPRLKWSWREQVGLPEEGENDIDGKTANVQVRHRRRDSERGGGSGGFVRGRNAGPYRGGGRNKFGGQQDRDEEESSTLASWASSWRGVLFFLALYVGLRILAKVVQELVVKYQLVPR